MSQIIINLPYPPTVNALFRNDKKRGGRVKTKRYLQWSRVAQNEIMAQRVAFPVKHIDGPFEAYITLDAERKGDIDNCVKAIIDALVEMNIVDDDRFLRRFTVETGKVDGAQVCVGPFLQRMAA